MKTERRDYSHRDDLGPRNQRDRDHRPYPSRKLNQTPLQVNREQTCPFLVRVFYKQGSHHSPYEFDRRGNEPSNEVNVYLWRDNSLRDIIDLLQRVIAEARSPTSFFDLRAVRIRNGRAELTMLGAVNADRRGPHDSLTLHDLRFDEGDYIDIAILPTTPSQDKPL